MIENAGTHLERESVLNVLQYPGAQQRGARVDQQEQSKAKGQHKNKISVDLGDRLIDHELHQKRTGEHVQLQDCR